jgi:hypothetical protein
MEEENKQENLNDKSTEDLTRAMSYYTSQLGQLTFVRRNVENDTNRVLQALDEINSILLSRPDLDPTTVKFNSPAA